MIVPGGVDHAPQLAASDLLTAVGQLDKQVSADLSVLRGTASFLDRLRRTGPLRPERATEHGALGPVGRASGRAEDIRQTRPYDAYGSLSVRTASRPDGDAMARLDVRAAEIGHSFHLLRQAADELGEAAGGPLRAPCERPAAAQRAGPRPPKGRCCTT